MNFNTKQSNVTKIDSYIRYILSFVFIVLSVYTQCYALMLLSMALAYTAIKRHCFLYNIFKINERYSLQNYYMSHLPKYNPSAVFMFDKADKIYFANESAKTNFSHISTLEDFNIDEFEKNKSSMYYYIHQDHHYQLDIRFVQEINTHLLYATDVTKIIELNDEIENTQKEIIYTMGEIGETRSKETGNHVKRVARYSEILALLYGLDEKEAKKLKLASPMHDIGKIAIPDIILNKPGRHTVEEFEIMKTHAQLGFDMLNKSHRPIIQAASIVAKEHHEKWDGSGYPLGLSGENIHIYGRITAVADVFDALGSKRVYKEAWELNKILDLFKEQKGKHFDPHLVELFLNNLDKFLEIRDKYQD
jgi:response regulator RpfG family c-di-GMP phosphodiesterase